MSGTFLDCCPLHILMQGPSLNLDSPFWRVWLACLTQRFSVSCLHALRSDQATTPTRHAHPGLMWSLEIQALDFISTLSPEPALQLCRLFLS